MKIFSNNGATQLSGHYVHRCVCVRLCQAILAQLEYKDIGGNKRALAKLRCRCERARRSLFSQTEVGIEHEIVLDGKDFSEPLTGAWFKEHISELFYCTLKPAKQVRKGAVHSETDIHESVLVGESTKIPEEHLLFFDFSDFSIYFFEQEL